MIPYALCMLRLFRGGEISDVRVLDPVPGRFTLRLPKSMPDPGKWERLEALFLDYASQNYDTFTLSAGEFTLEPLREDETGACLLSFRTDDRAFRARWNRLLTDYAEYVRTRTENDEVTAMEDMTGIELSDAFPRSVAEWQKRMRAAAVPGEDAFRDIDPVEIAVCLDTPRLREAFLCRPLPDFLELYWAGNGLTGHPVTKQPVTHVYIGHPTCPLLFPDAETLLRLIDRARETGLVPVIEFSAMPEPRVPAVRECLEAMAARLSPLPEVVIGDLGIARLAEEVQEAYRVPADGRFRLRLGPLLMKRKKDIRIPWRPVPGNDREANRRTDWNSPELWDFVRTRFGITGLTCEVTGYPIEIPAADTALMLPLFRMNTAGTCTLAAVCRTGDRGQQTENDACPAYCETCAVYYPENLPMIGRWNSLLGCDLGALNDTEALNGMIRAGVTRLVIRM